MGQILRIALLLDRGLSFVRGVIQGVRVYAADKPNWVLRDGPPRLNLVSHVREWEPVRTEGQAPRGERFLYSPARFGLEPVPLFG